MHVGGKGEGGWRERRERQTDRQTDRGAGRNKQIKLTLAHAVCVTIFNGRWRIANYIYIYIYIYIYNL